MKAFFRTAAVFTAFSLPLASGGCNTKEDKPNDVQIVKPIDINLKKAIDEKRIVLEKKEREFASELGAWASSDLPNVLINLYMVSDSKEEILEGRNIAFKLAKRSEDFIELTGNDYSKKPNEGELEAFNRLISMAQKGAPFTWSYSTMKLEEISEKIESYLQKKNPELKGEKLKEEVKLDVEYFKVYKETLVNIRGLRDNLSLSMQDFNKDAKKINEPAYNPIWGLNQKKLEDITIFVSKK